MLDFEDIKGALVKRWGSEPSPHSGIDPGPVTHHMVTIITALYFFETPLCNDF